MCRAGDRQSSFQVRPLSIDGNGGWCGPDSGSRDRVLLLGRLRLLIGWGMVSREMDVTGPGDLHSTP